MSSAKIETNVLFRHDTPLELSRCYEFVRSPRCGAISLFVGTIRDKDPAVIEHEDGAREKVQKQIRSIYYEAYESMAEKQISQFVENLSTKEEVQSAEGPFEARVCVEIRLGFVPVGEAAIIICISSVRRHQSSWMVMSLLQQIKTRAVIWKKIVFTDGEEQWDLEEKSEASWIRKPVA